MRKPDAIPALEVEEIARRRPVWTALSTLFLDTELDDRDLAVIAATIKGAGYSAATAEAILFDEIAPVFVGNLITPAGEWAGWSEEDVSRLVSRRLARSPAKPALMTTWFGKLTRPLYVKEWRLVKAKLD